MLQNVPMGSIISMTVTAFVSLLLPIAALIFFRKKTGGRFSAVFIGAGTFIAFALILETLLHQLVLAAAGQAAFENIWFYAIYGGLAAGIFEETGRLLSMKLLMKKTLCKRDSLMFGTGHGGAEAIILGGLTYLSNAAIALMINSGAMEQTLSTMDDATRAITVQQLSALWTSPSYMFLISALERIVAFVLQLCLSYIVYRAVRYKKPLLYILAVFLHFLMDALIVLIAKFSSVFAAEGVLFVMTACLSVIAFRAYRSEKEPEPEQTSEPESIQEAEIILEDKNN